MNFATLFTVVKLWKQPVFNRRMDKEICIYILYEAKEIRCVNIYTYICVCVCVCVEGEQAYMQL